MRTKIAKFKMPKKDRIGQTLCTVFDITNPELFYIGDADFMKRMEWHLLRRIREEEGPK